MLKLKLKCIPKASKNLKLRYREAIFNYIFTHLIMTIDDKDRSRVIITVCSIFPLPVILVSFAVYTIITFGIFRSVFCLLVC